MHYFQFHIGDWFLGTNHLDSEEEYCYFKLILEYYDTEKPLGLDVIKLARRLKMKGRHEVVAQMLEEFFTETVEGWVNHRCDIELINYASKAEKARQNGKKGGRPKNPEKPSRLIPLTEPYPNPNPDESGLQTNHKPLTINQEPLTNSSNKLEGAAKAAQTKSFNVEFNDKFWPFLEDYPNNKNPDSAQKRWCELRRAGYEPKQIQECYLEYGVGSNSPEYSVQFVKACTTGSLKMFVKKGSTTTDPNEETEEQRQERHRKSAERLGI